MKSKMSFFDPTLLKKNVARFAPAWAILLVFWILTGPLALLRELEYSGTAALRREEALRHFGNQSSAGVIVAVFAALVFGALVFKYLHNARSAYMMHAFPMTRSCLFITNAVSGLLFWLAPALITVLLYQAVLGARGVSGCEAELWSLLGSWTLQYLVFYGLAVFTMHISGSSVIAVLSYGALNFLFLVLPLLVLLLIRAYFRGFDYTIPETILRLAPVVGLLADKTAGPGLLWIYAGIGVLLLVLAWVHYRYRQVERAGDPMAFGWARIAFRIIFTLVCALGLGWVLAAFFGLINSNRTVFLPYALLGCFLGWFGSSMMVERTVKVFKKKKVWLGFAVFAAVLCVLVLGLKYDVLGFQRRIPETAKVESVEIWTHGDYDEQGADQISLTEAADIEAVRAFHLQALRHSSTEEGLRDLFSDNYYGQYVHICYHLSDGTTLRRVYNASFPVSGTEDYTVRALAEFYSRPEIAAAWYEKHLPQRFVRVLLEGMLEAQLDENGYMVTGWDTRECKDPAALRDAVLADAAAGRLPVVNFLCGEAMDSDSYGYSGWGELNLSYMINRRDGEDLDYNDYRYLEIPILSTATETVALFE